MTVSQASTTASVEAAFGEVGSLIRAARPRTDQLVNTGMIDLYWCLGQYLHHKIEADGWAKGTVMQLAAYIALREPGKRGFSSQNLWRMRQFFEAYPAAAKLSPAVREIHGGAAAGFFKDAYALEFLSLPVDHTEADLHSGLLVQLRAFLIELGRDFCFVGSQFPVQVGGRDFAFALLFFARALTSRSLE